MDCCVLTWDYCTISNDLQQSLMIRDPTARVAWLYLEDEFLGHRESRALLLEAEFRSFKQGDLSITDYCRRLKMMAASLGEFSDPIGDRQLILTLLRDLNGKFRHMVSNLKMQRPFPTFAEARTLLLLEEIDVNDIHDDGTPAPASQVQALLATKPSSQPEHGDGGGHSSSGGAAPSGSNGKGGSRNRRRGRGGNSGNGGNNSTTGPRLPTAQTGPRSNPWSGTV
jgi:hypothetical protein